MMQIDRPVDDKVDATFFEEFFTLTFYEYLALRILSDEFIYLVLMTLFMIILLSFHFKSYFLSHTFFLFIDDSTAEKYVLDNSYTVSQLNLSTCLHYNPYRNNALCVYNFPNSITLVIIFAISTIFAILNFGD